MLLCRLFQEKELDIFIVTTSRKGFGKSSLIMQGSRAYAEMFNIVCDSCGHEWTYSKPIVSKLPHSKIRYDNVDSGLITHIENSTLNEPCPKCGNTKVSHPKRFNFMKYLAYDNDEVQDKVYGLPDYSPLLGDEAVRWMMGEDWNKYENKEMKKLFAQMRTKRLLVFGNIPKFKWADSKYRDEMTTFWIRILVRGLAVVLQPDLGEVEDSWHIKEFKDLLGSYFFTTPHNQMLSKAQKLKERHPCVLDYFSVPPLPREIYDDYLKARNAKVFARKKRETAIDEKQIAKLCLWNLSNKWGEIVGAVKSGKFDRPTIRILEEFVACNPKTEEPLVRHSTLSNWLNDINKIMKERD